jgi:hypothetical protein
MLNSKRNISIQKKAKAARRGDIIIETNNTTSAFWLSSGDELYFSGCDLWDLSTFRFNRPAFCLPL